MRIVILSGSVPTTTFIDALINTMAEEGFEVIVIGKKTGEWNYHKNVEVVIVPESVTQRVLFAARLLLATGFKHFSKIMAASKGLYELLNNLVYYLPIIAAKPDRVHLQWTAFVHKKELLFDLFPEKVLVSLRGAHINYTPITTPEIKESYLKLLPKVYKFHAVSQAIKQEALQYGVSAEKTEVIYSSVSDELLNKNIQYKQNNGVLNIISVGRFFWKKGYGYSLDAMSLLKQQGIVFKYTIIAEGTVPAEIKYQLHQLKLMDDVHIINGLPHAEVLEHIEQHDVLLLPSVEEGIANVVLEAMALGTLVITTNVGGMQEVVVNNENGFVVPVRDIIAISEALKKVSKLSIQERSGITKQAKQTIVTQHNKKDFAKNFARFYRD